MKKYGLYYNWNMWNQTELGRYMEVEKIDKMGYVDIGRVKWIEALYMTTRLNNSYVYSYNNPIRWVDILGLRPGDVFYDIYNAIEDALAYSYFHAFESGLEYGGCIRPAAGSEKENANVCLNRFPRFYTYDEPYPGKMIANKLFWEPIGGIPNCLLFYHAYPWWSVEYVSTDDKKRARTFKEWAAIGLSDGSIKIISIDGDIYEYGIFDSTKYWK